MAETTETTETAETESSPPGRNEPCHCGSGKKYKRCCRSLDEEKARKAHAKAAANAPEAPEPEPEDKKTHEAPDRRPGVDESWRRGPQTRHPYQRLMTPRKRGDR